jgi:hypothetical protein
MEGDSVLYCVVYLSSFCMCMQAQSWLLAWLLSHVHTCNMSQICLLLGRLTTSKSLMHHCCQCTEISAKLFQKRDLSVCQRNIPKKGFVSLSQRK